MTDSILIKSQLAKYLQILKKGSFARPGFSSRTRRRTPERSLTLPTSRACAVPRDAGPEVDLSYHILFVHHHQGYEAAANMSKRAKCKSTAIPRRRRRRHRRQRVYLAPQHRALAIHPSKPSIPELPAHQRPNLINQPDSTAVVMQLHHHRRHLQPQGHGANHGALGPRRPVPVGSLLSWKCLVSGGRQLVEVNIVMVAFGGNMSQLLGNVGVSLTHRCRIVASTTTGNRRLAVSEIFIGSWRDGWSHGTAPARQSETNHSSFCTTTCRCCRRLVITGHPYSGMPTHGIFECRGSTTYLTCPALCDLALRNSEQLCSLYHSHLRPDVSAQAASSSGYTGRACISTGRMVQPSSRNTNLNHNRLLSLPPPAPSPPPTPFPLGVPSPTPPTYRIAPLFTCPLLASSPPRQACEQPSGVARPISVARLPIWHPPSLFPSDPDPAANSALWAAGTHPPKSHESMQAADRWIEDARIRWRAASKPPPPSSPPPQDQARPNNPTISRAQNPPTTIIFPLSFPSLPAVHSTAPSSASGVPSTI
ncbi:hypothetical protein PCL_04150 [Purpureocillium lilacinum]|uniref:Uncharacterized protein n=1 Tax=Purpureocillium lilacinum TaxID=33203 RepID=A0A2U3ER31_PURLI|nr:hypothetical protein PCL_04150 [Purpureocillium lilacinum]